MAEQDDGQEPDYRFTLANERTFLAWLRTGLALDAAGLAAAHLLPELVIPGAREALGLALVLLGSVVSVSGYRRWRAHQLAIRRDEPLPATVLPLVLAVGLTVVAALALALLVIAQVSAP